MKSILQFELSHYRKRIGFYTLFALLFGFGFLVATKARLMSLPNMFKNAPYNNTYFIGFMSLVCIFISTLLAVQVLFREKEARFSAILYTTPLSKLHYLSSRFIVVFGLTIFLFMGFALGIMLGHQVPWLDRSEYAPFNIWHYLQPLLLLALPNALFCSAMVSSVAWLSKNKIMVYVTGLFIYIGYMATLIFSSSPLIAGSMPQSELAQDISAKLDPFGLSAFFQQTQQWSAIQRNTHMVALTGNMLFNRLLFMGISALALLIGFTKFQFKIDEKKSRWKLPTFQKFETFGKLNVEYKPIFPQVFTLKHYIQSLFSLVKIDLIYVIKSLPFLLITIGLGFYISMEIYGYIEKGIRLPENYASTELMVNTILKQFPPLCLFVLLFYGFDVFWRSRTENFDLIENSTPLGALSSITTGRDSISTQFYAKWLSLTTIIALLLTCIIGVSIIFQIAYQYSHFEWSLYASVYYLVGLPLILASGVMLFIHALFSNKYIGLVVATVVSLLMTTSFGKMAGINHPLFRFSSPYAGLYSDMNEFGAYFTAFHWRMVFGLSLLLLLICTVEFIRRGGVRRMNSTLQLSAIPYMSNMVASEGRLKSPAIDFDHENPSIGGDFNRPSDIKNNEQIPFLSKYRIVAYLVILLPIISLSGFYIYKNTEIKDKDATLNWQQTYEQKYRPYQNMPQPTVTDITTTIDLYPEKNAYTVKGIYRFQNKTNQDIDSVLVFLDNDLNTDGTSRDNREGGYLRLTNADLLSKDTTFGHYWIRFAKYLMPNESRHLEFSFTYKWSPFKGHEAFNAIVENGSFMRISNYFPRFGYQSGLEMADEKERTKRNLGKATPFLKLEDPLSIEDDFIGLDMTISTSKNQTAIGVGELIKTWSDNDRHYFQYKTPSPIPFRFGISSAEYATQKAIHNGKSIEVYYHPNHYENVGHLIENAKKTLDYCETNFGAYPYKTIRFAEISSFTRGFAATAYPATIFMPENMIFHANIKGDKQQDVINELAGHELSHEWWGANQLAPDNREGAKFLTETLAMYTELMLVKKMYGQERVLDVVAMHQNIYLSARGYTDEQPLYKTIRDNTHIHYSKGLVTMYQLSVLIGEDIINKALKKLLQKHAYPKPTPISTDLLSELYAVSDTAFHPKIDDLFKRITTYKFDIKYIKTLEQNKQFIVNLDIEAFKYNEDGKGNQTRVDFNEVIDVGFYFEKEGMQILKCPIVSNNITQQVMLEKKPVKMVIDPNMLFIQLEGKNAERAL